MRYNLQSHKQHRGGGTLDGVEGGHREGHAYTPHGVVRLYASGPAGEPGFTSYRFALGGRDYYFREEVSRSDRGAILMAHMLVKQAVAEEASAGRGPVTLRMARDVALSLMSIVGKVGGCPERSYRKHVDVVWDALEDAGLSYRVGDAVDRRFDAHDPRGMWAPEREGALNA